MAKLLDITTIRWLNARAILRERGLTVSAASEACGISRARGSHIFGPRVIKPIGNQAARDAEIGLGLEPGWLDVPHFEIWEKHHLANDAGTANIGASITGKIPLVSDVRAFAAGEGGAVERMVVAPAGVGDSSFAVRVFGNSMQPDLPEGSIVIFDPEREPQDGKFVLAMLANEEHVIRRLVTDGAHKWLSPMNQSYPAAPLDGATILGIAVSVLIELP